MGKPPNDVTAPDLDLATFKRFSRANVIGARQEAREAQHVARPEDSHHHVSAGTREPPVLHAALVQHEQLLGPFSCSEKHLGRVKRLTARFGDDGLPLVRVDAGKQSIRPVPRS